MDQFEEDAHFHREAIESLNRIARWVRALTVSQYVLMVALLVHAWMVKVP
jgi:hypothetical protein